MPAVRPGTAAGLLLLLLAAGAAAADEAPAIHAVAPLGAVSDPRPLVRAAFGDDEGVVANLTVILLDGRPLNLSRRTETEAAGRPAAPLADGRHVAEVLVRDGAGNTARRSWEFVVRAAVPADAETGARIASVSFAGGFVSELKPFAVSFDGDTLEAYLDGAPLAVDANAGRAVVETPTDVAEGRHDVRLVARAADGTEAERVVPFVLDRTPPSVAFVDATELPAAVAVSWREDHGIRTDRVLVTLDGAPLNASLGPDGGRIELPPLHGGRHELRVNVTDLAGNEGSASHAFVVEAGAEEGDRSETPAPGLLALAVALALLRPLSLRPRKRYAGPPPPGP